MTAATGERTSPVWRIVVLAVAAVLFAYVTVQAVGNLVGVRALIGQYNAFVTGSAVATRTVPWLVLVLDVAMAPVAYAVAFLATRRMTAGRTAVVFLTALCAVSALWFSFAQFVQPSVTLPGL